MSEELRQAVWRALDSVLDPELDESIVALGFVASCAVQDGGDVRVTLRLPTFFCAANFAYLMVEEAARALRALPGTRGVQVTLEDHFEGDAITTGVAHGRGFRETFGAEAAAELDELRRTFGRKSVLAAVDRAVAALAAAGHRAEDLVGRRFGEVPELPEVDALRRRREAFGADAGDGAPLLAHLGDGRAIGRDELDRHLAEARLTRTSIEANGLVCRQLLHDRHHGGAEVTIRRTGAATAAVAARR